VIAELKASGSGLGFFDQSVDVELFHSILYLKFLFLYAIQIQISVDCPFFSLRNQIITFYHFPILPVFFQYCIQNSWKFPLILSGIFFGIFYLG
jgi:hypothetical protein